MRGRHRRVLIAFALGNAMRWEILFDKTFNKVEELARGEAEDSDKVPEGVFTFGDLRALIRLVRDMGLDRNKALREADTAREMLDGIDAILRRRDE